MTVNFSACRSSFRSTFVFLRVFLRAPLQRVLKKILRVQLIFFLCVLCVLCVATTFAFAENYPSKPIRIIVPYPPGGFNDTLARTLGQKLTEKWGQPVIVDNRPGGGTTIGTNLAAKSAPDGYTLLIVSFAFAVNPALYAFLPYDTTRDFDRGRSSATSSVPCNRCSAAVSRSTPISANGPAPRFSTSPSSATVTGKWIVANPANRPPNGQRW